MVEIFYIDLFSGAGGTTTGIHLAGSQVLACVNHDEKAIESHKANHPECIHFIEDVRDYKVIRAIKNIVEKARRENPGCVIVIWSSLECTNYSKAKGGQARDADSRTLAFTMYNYIDEIQPDLVQIENVREFMAWGPLDDKGRPISRMNGVDYQRWIRTIERMGYEYDWKLLNSANYGAYTSRERYFGQFSNGVPIRWPKPTHSKEPLIDGLFNQQLKRWKPVKDVLDLQDEGNSIFERSKPLVEATLKRIYAGLDKFVANGEPGFTKVYNSGNYKSRVKSLNEPVGSLTTQNSHATVKCKFMMKNYSGHPGSKVHDLNRPAGTVTTIDHNSIVSVDKSFLTSYYGNGNAHDTKEPCPTVTCKDRFSFVKPQFLTSYYSGGGQLSSIDKPSPTIMSVPKQRLTSVLFVDQQYGQSKPTSVNGPLNTLTTNPKFNLVSAQRWLMNTNFNNVGSSLEEPAPTILACRKHHYLMNPQFNSKGGSIEKPCFTLIARMDKMPPYLIEAQEGMQKAIIQSSDSVMTIKIKRFMQQYGISDIKMRMLKIPELLQIQGFPKEYNLKGTQGEMKKFIGNAVEVNMAKAIAEATKQSIQIHTNQKQAV